MSAPSVTIVDYGLGNLASVARAIQFLGGEPEISFAPDKIGAAERLVLPGVGAFGVAMSNLRERGLVEPLRSYAASGRPLLGLCLGMQLFMETSDEDGVHEGLGLVRGRVTKIVGDGARRKVPHIGWAGLQPAAQGWRGSVLEGVQPGDALYFVHSYVAEPADPVAMLARARYAGVEYCAVLGCGNVVGCQAHPEKSAATGLKLLGNFLAGRAH